MPVYGSAPPKTAEGGIPQAVWNDENVTAGSSSLAVGLQRNENLSNCLSVELLFAANPGAIKVDLQTADTNEEKCFVTKASYETGLSAQFVGRIEATNIVAKFVRLKMVTLTNAVKVTARIF